MNKLFLEAIEDCITSFTILYNQDRYISKKEYDQFLDNYASLFDAINNYPKYDNETYQKFIMILNHGYEMVELKNNHYLDKKLVEEKEYFDNMFKDVDRDILLDIDQRKAILIDEDYSLVIAGAGSGKTTTMAAKVKYLIDRKHIDPSTIILLSFTNKAVEELDNIINNKFHLNVEVLTFHKLGMKFIRNMINKSVKIVGDTGINQILTEYFVNVVFKDKALLSEFYTAFEEFLYLDEECFNYDTYDDYYSYYMDKKYNECKDDLDSEIRKRIRQRSRYLKTIDGKYVKSDGELNIANYLYKQGINYKYEALYPFQVGGGRSYSPDFTIMNFDVPIYVEYFGYAKLNKNNTYESENSRYEREIKLKQNTHLKNKTDLIELYGKYENGDFYLPKLSYELTVRKVFRKKRDNKEIFYELMETSKSFPYFRFINLARNFISLFKEKNYFAPDFKLLIDKCDDEKIKKQLQLLRKVYDYYQYNLHKQYKIDFQDMIHYAYKHMEKLRKSNLNYNYIIVDEYQDISYQRYSFLKKISDLFNAKIVAVGDDWQSIFSFSGSDVDLFTNFCDNMGYAEEIQITKTYRNSQELIDLAGEFVSKNSKQIKKSLVSSKKLAKPVKLVRYNYDDVFDDLPQVLTKLIKEIYQKHPNDKILLLSRFNEEIDNLIDSKMFYRLSKDSEKIICKEVPQADITLLTVHKSKGLGFDRVILLNAINASHGFPSQIQDAPVISVLKEKTSGEENLEELIEYPEERRLFYVAMTRTKNELYIMVPTIFKFKSEFVKEIENNEYVEIY